MYSNKYLLTILVLSFLFSKSNAQSNEVPLFQLYDIDIETIIAKAERNSNNIQISLPFPNGEWKEFTATFNSVLVENLQQQYQGIYTFDLNHPNMKGKLTIGNRKLYVQVRTNKGLLAILPSIADPTKYKAYFGNFDPEQPNLPADAYLCDQSEDFDWDGGNARNDSQDEKSGNGFNRGGVLTTYRLSIVTTGEFEDANGANSMARITSTVQGWNLIYEADLGITLSVVNTQIYNDPNTDPFTPDGAGGDHRVNQAAEVIAMNFADNTYDVGQVFHNSSVGANWSGGGVAGLGVVCSNSTFFSTSSSYESPNDGLTGPNKSAAWSGSFNNTGNGWIQLSAHELGHQFNASHTFNGNGSNCEGGNLPQNDAYEIGSGTTIMSYNGLCGAGQNLPDGGEDDNYFHASSLDRMVNFITTGGGSNCGTDSNIANTAPAVDASPNANSYTIPINTPFELVGSATDAEGDNLTYCWEQYDEDGAGSTSTHGKIGAAAAADPIAPLFRSFPPQDDPNRVFPSLSNILDGDNTSLPFEALPSVARSMTFAFTVRDNNPLGGSVVCDNIEIDVEDRGGAFELTSQNAPTSLFSSGGSGTFTVTWNVAGTTGGGIQCAQVDILFSTDGGITFPTTLASNTSNDGSQTFNIPASLTTTGRIKIKCSDNIFFDINNADITITDQCEADGVTFSPDNAVSADAGDASLDLNLMPNYDVLINDFNGTLATSDPASNLAFDNLNGNCSGPSNSNNYNAFEFIADATGNYTFNRSGSFGQLLNIYQGTFDANNVCSGWLGSTATRPSGSGSVNLGSSVTVNLSAGTTYSLVVSTFSTNSSYYGAYTVTYSGAGQLLEEVPADPGFAYTYVIIENAGNTIVSFENDPDLRNYSGGDYTIYGLEHLVSISTASLNSDYVGDNFSDLQNDISTGALCADLSSNSKSVTVTGNGGGNFPDDVIDGETYDGETAIVRACDMIEATSDIMNGSDVTFIAGDFITLKAGFFVENGSNFQTTLQACSPAQQDIEQRSSEISESIPAGNLRIYPNPTSSVLQLELSTKEAITDVFIFDQLGRIVKNWTGDRQSITLDFLPTGIYILVVQGETHRYQQKVIKE